MQDFGKNTISLSYCTLNSHRLNNIQLSLHVNYRNRDRNIVLLKLNCDADFPRVDIYLTVDISQINRHF